MKQPQPVSNAHANSVSTAALTAITLAPPDIAYLRPRQTVCFADGACEPTLAVLRLRDSWLVRSATRSGQYGRGGGIIAPTPETNRIMGVVR